MLISQNAKISGFLVRRPKRVKDLWTISSATTSKAYANIIAPPPDFHRDESNKADALSIPYYTTSKKPDETP